MMDCKQILEKARNLRLQYHPLAQFPESTAPERLAEYENNLSKIVGWIGDVEGKTFLDVGCFYGYYCFKLADMGAICTGVDYIEDRIELCNCLKGESPHLEFVYNDIGSYLEAFPDHKFDYVIMLKVFQHIAAKQKEYGWWIFNELARRSKAMFLQMGITKRPWDGMGDRTFCKTKEDIPNLILENSSYNRFEKLAHYTGNPLFKRADEEPPHLYVFWKYREDKSDTLTQRLYEGGLLR